jgi:hypothetical protein
MFSTLPFLSTYMYFICPSLACVLVPDDGQSGVVEGLAEVCDSGLHVHRSFLHSVSGFVMMYSTRDECASAHDCYEECQ